MYVDCSVVAVVDQVEQRDVPGIDNAFLAMDTEEGVEVVWNEVQFSEKKNFRAQQVSTKQLLVLSRTVFSTNCTLCALLCISHSLGRPEGQYPVHLPTCMMQNLSRPTFTAQVAMPLPEPLCSVKIPSEKITSVRSKNNGAKVF